MSTTKAQERLQAAFDRLEAAARALKDSAQGDDKVETLQAELDKARADNAALAKVTDSASSRIDAAAVRLRSVLDGG
jgi:peptidoglycan hydrolase CwlO-like protein